MKVCARVFIGRILLEIQIRYMKILKLLNEIEEKTGDIYSITIYRDYSGSLQCDDKPSYGFGSRNYLA